MKVIPCAECGFENDNTRIFCQNCGTRLAVDTPTSGKLFVPATQEAPKAASRPIRQARPPAAAPQTGGGGRLIRALVSTAIIAAVLAAVVQMIRPPDLIPPARPIDSNAATALFQGMKTLTETTSSRIWQSNQDQVNNYLAARIIAAPDDGGFRSKFARAFVLLGNGNYNFYIEQRVFNWPIYLYVTQQPISMDGVLTVRSTGGGIGRLPFDPRLVPLLERMITPVQGAVYEATDLLQKASAATITPKQVTISWGATKPPTP